MLSSSAFSSAVPLLSNPLFVGDDALPDFARVMPDHVEPAITALIADARAKLRQLAAPGIPASWEDFAAPLAEALTPLARAWGVAGHFHAVMDTADWRKAYNAALPEVSRFYSELGQNLAIFEKYKALRQSAEFQTLSAARQQLVNNELRDFRLSGADLSEKDKPRFLALQEELAQLGAKFSENLLDATNAFSLSITDPADLSGLPKEALDAAREANGKEAGWKFTLHAPSWTPFMQYAENRTLRYEMYRAYAIRASEFSDAGSRPEWDNAPVMRQILRLKTEKARILGFKNYAEVSLSAKMVQTPEQALQFLRDMARRARPFAERDLQELSAFASEHLGLSDLQPWDVPFASEKLRQARYDFSEQEVRAYFREPEVLSGLFSVIERLYGVRVREADASVWEESVRFYRLETQDGAPLGAFYLDLYARETKRGGAWMDGLISRQRMRSGPLALPLACIVCNFSRPVGQNHATFTHAEVETLFHETGHALHHLLTQVEESGISGIDGVEWDAVELPSQFMENFAWEWEVLRDITAHTETGEALPRALFERMRAARNFQIGLQTMRQMEFALFDMLLHSAFSPDTDDIFALLEAVRAEAAVLFPPKWQRFPNSFSHIFGGGYAAGYYSYKWAEVLSADAYAAFEEARAKNGSILDAATGARFLREILATGGSRPALSSFVAFRKRAPSPDALLRHNGMQSATIAS
ncbi:MAG: M3 family metallopeptidase [Zoogloeaceae bacterium]|jgi:oligopeptidase A|nr:M3 family metallopeptidase [Zoogloeaceae bacterium]